MKHIIRLLVAIFIIHSARAQVYSQYVVGYVNRTFVSGNNLFCNPLEANANILSVLFDPAALPVGTTISLWNPSTATFDTTSTNSGNAWTLDLTLNPGTGALLVAPSAFTTTFVGYVDDHAGNPYTGTAIIPPPPLFSGPDGIYLLGDKSPIADTGTDIFLNILGRLPNIGEQVSTYAGTSTYLGDGNWDVIPTLNVGDAAFLNIGGGPNIAPAPEPATLTLGLLGLTLIPVFRRRRP